MTGEPPDPIDTAVEVSATGWATVTFASGRGAVAISGPHLDVLRAIVEADRQLSRFPAAPGSG